MTSPEDAFITPVVEGSIPAPPPPVAAAIAGENFDETTGYIPLIWDLVAVHGPAKDYLIRSKVPVISNNWRDYARFHHSTQTKDPSDQQLALADTWAFENAVRHMLTRGWLTRDTQGDLALGICPPTHTPFSTMGGEQQVRRHVQAMTDNQAMEMLRAKTNPMRITPSKEGRALLKRELQNHGQGAPIVRWKTRSLNGFETFIVDGQTREEILLGPLKKDESEIWYVDLPGDWTPAEVLLLRISCEVAGTSKGEEARNAYIVEMAKTGSTQAEIAKEIGLSHQHVSRILSQPHTHVRVRQSPSDVDVQEWRLLSEAGWSVRDISRRTQWGKDTIHRALVKAEAVASGELPPEGPKLPFGRGTVKWKLLEAALRWGPATEPELKVWYGDTQGSTTLTGGLLINDGYLKDAGKVKGRRLLEATDKARELMPDVQPEPQPIAKKPAAPKPAPEPAPAPVRPPLSIVPDLYEQYLTALESQILDSGFGFDKVISDLQRRHGKQAQSS